MAKSEKFNQIIQDYLTGKDTIHKLLENKYEDLKLNVNDVINYIKYNYLSDPSNDVFKSVEKLRNQGFVV